MGFPIRTCKVCGEEFELRPDHQGYANRCVECNEAKDETAAAPEPASMTAEERRVQREADAERRRVIREMLYSKK